MKRSAALLFSFIAISAQAELALAPPPAEDPAILQWRNGETLPGALTDATADEISWKSPIFEDPLHLRWQSLRRIDQGQDAVAPTDPFSIILRDGSRIYGDLVGVTESAILIHSARHGDASLKRAEVLSVRRIRGESLITAGPAGDAGWQVLANREVDRPETIELIQGGGGLAVRSRRRPSAASSNPSPPPLTVGPGGALVIPYWNRSAGLPLKLPPLAEVELRVRTSARPDFRLSSLEGSSKQWLRLETWDDELVLATADQFESIRPIADDERTIALRLYWDQKARACSVYTPEGKLLTEWKMPEDQVEGSPGLVLHNKGRDLSLEFLRVRPWDGHPPQTVDLAQARVELGDGRIVTGKIGSSAANAIQVKESGSETETDYAFGDLDALVFADEKPELHSGAAVLSYADGTILYGRILSIKDGEAAVQVAFAEAPLSVEMHGLREALLGAAAPPGASAETPLSDLDELVIGETTLHGQFSGAGDRWPRWLPVGAAAPSIPARTLPLKIRRAILASAPAPEGQALFFLRTGDVLPGRLTGVEPAGAEIESDIVETKVIPGENLDAIQFGATSQRKMESFSDPGWEIVKGDEKSVVRNGGSLRMEPETALGHPFAMQTNELKLEMDSSGFQTVRLRLYCAGTDPARSLNIVVSRMGERAYAGMELVEGQLGTQFQMKAPQGRPLVIRLTIMEKQVEIYLNDVLAQKIPTDPAKRAGAGLIIEPASLWGNGVNPVSLSGFSAHAIPGQVWLPDVNTETKNQALTVPRFLRDHLPRQALLAANGDLLRGEIDAVSPTHFGFRAGLEELRVPRNRVKAVVWLKPPQKDLPPAPPPNPMLERLQQRTTQRVRFPRAGLRMFISILQSGFPDLKFKLPDREDQREFPMELQGETIAESLDRMCLLFGLRYRVAEDGTIILEPAPRTVRGLAQKTYWLRSDAFPATPSAQEILVGKGIPFPPGTAAVWHPETQQLSVSNTASNLARLSSLLEAEFGGTLGSPTHWLLLTSGARLGFAVEKFEPDSILGRHPLYGQCHIPMAQVYSITTSVPEPLAAADSLRDWRLVLAPEPVIPESGGESSALLGKEAKTFQLPLLGGGEFDLAKQHGKIVVLDFWATWCGPCVKSLPELTEALAAFPPDRVTFIGVNQAEQAGHVKQFMETRSWKFAVAMDADQNVARQYGVDGIPHTVIIDADGKIAWIKTGYSPDGEKEAAEVIKKLLAGPAAIPN